MMMIKKEIGGSGGWRWPFLTKLPKGTSLADFTRFEPLCLQFRSRVYFARRLDEKEHYKKSQRGYISLICG